VGRSAADIENAALRTGIEKLPMKIPIQQANRFFLFPQRLVGNLTLVQTIRII